MQTAQQWRERMGQQRSLEWDEMIDMQMSGRLSSIEKEEYERIQASGTIGLQRFDNSIVIYPYLTRNDLRIHRHIHPDNSFNYSWRVRVWDETDTPSEWSSEAKFRAVPERLSSGQWIGAITRQNAHLPEGRKFYFYGYGGRENEPRVTKDAESD